MAPRGTPQSVVNQLNAAVSKAVDTPDIKQLWAKQGAVPMSMSPAAFDTYIQLDINKWAKVIKTANIKLD